jgi:hypothetical protein
MSEITAQHSKPLTKGEFIMQCLTKTGQVFKENVIIMKHNHGKDK